MERNDRDNSLAGTIIAVLAVLLVLMFVAGSVVYFRYRHARVEAERARLEAIEAQQQAALTRQRELQRGRAD